MESKVGNESHSKVGKKGENGSFSEKDKNDIPIQDFVTSESKTPLKASIKEREEDLQVKYIAPESGSVNEVNGDAKIDINDMRSCFSGMSKEELLKYANDPFWVRTRMFLFIFFWAVWIAMFVGAIAIIVVAPKCEPPKWFNQGPLYMVDIEAFLNLPADDDTHMLKAFSDKIPYLHDLNVKGIVLSSIFESDNSGTLRDVIDFKAIDGKYGTLDDFEELVKEARAKDINLMLSFIPNHSSDQHVWFNKSIAKESPYDNYYIWAPSSGVETDGSRLPPNNWLSVTGGSAWEWNDDRQEYYLHQFDVHQPDLNFRNPHLLKEFNETIKYWLNLGVAGFSMDRVQYLLEDKDLQNELFDRSKSSSVHTDYQFYFHSKTHNHPDTAVLLSQWRELIHKETNENGVLMISGQPPIPSDSDESEGNSTVVDITRNNKLLSGLTSNFTAMDLYPRLEKLVVNNEDWPTLQLGDENKRLSDICNEEDIDGMNIITLLIKGTPIIYFGEELGLRNKNHFPWHNSSDSFTEQERAKVSHYKIFVELMKARESKAVIYGSSNLTVMDDCLIALTRIKAGNPGYLSAYNLCHQNVTVDFSSVEHVPDELMIYLLSTNYGEEKNKVKDKVASSNFFMSPRSAVAFTFVPRIEESN